MVFSGGLRSFGLSCLGGVGGFALAKVIYPDVTYQENPQAIKDQTLEKENLPTKEFKIENKKSGILKYGAPTSGVSEVLQYNNHVLEYDAVKKVPKWVAEHISKEKAFGSEANRKLARFDKDPNIPALLSSDNRDFRGSGWSRGHMAPAGNNKHSQSAMNETFYLTNIVPQDIDNNGNYWNRLEIFCRELTNQYKDVYVISGPLWLPYNEDENPENVLDKNLPIKWKNFQAKTEQNLQTENNEKGDNEKTSKKWRRSAKKFVKYQVLGDNNVAVPTHLYKIILVEDPLLDWPMIGAFVVPNKPIQNVNLDDFEVEIEEIEKQVGVRFHQELDRTEVKSLCLSSSGCKLNNYKEFQEFFWYRRMSNPWSIRDLEKDWKTVSDMGLKSEKLNDVYINKKKELEEKEKLKSNEKMTKEEMEKKPETKNLPETGNTAPKAQVEISAAA